MEENKARFVDLLSSINRPGIDKLLEWLGKTNFYSSPASSKYHSAVEGGLVIHSLAVYDQLTKIIECHGIECKPETAIIVALLHDLCKANFFAVSERNVKDPIIDGEQKTGWHKVPYYTIEDQMPLGHGSKSLILLQAFIRPTIDEIMAIVHHMGAWGAEGYTDKLTLSAAMEKYPLVLALQVADQMATFWERK